MAARNKRHLVPVTEADNLLNLFSGARKHDPNQAWREEQGREAVGFVREQLVRIPQDARRPDDALEALDEIDIQHVIKRYRSMAY